MARRGTGDRGTKRGAAHGGRRRLPVVVAAAAMLVSLVGTVPAGAADGNYGRNDGGGFRNVLPPGEKGVDSAGDFTSWISTGNLPLHWGDQQPLYENLLYAEPRLTNSQIRDYYKDATFGVRRGDVESRIHPRGGLTIIRDRQYGIPHIYGKTRAAAMFGAGYAGAADRMFLMDVLRHTGRAQLSSFLGGSSLSSDEDLWRSAPYTERDYHRQLQLAVQLYGKTGRKMVADVRDYTAGVNAYIAKARQNSALMPVEYALIGQPLRNWKATDVLAVAALVGGIFGRGGGRELDSAMILQALEQRFGVRNGRRIWSSFRSKNDPEAPITTAGSFPYMLTSAFARRGLALPEPGSVVPAPILTQGTAPAEPAAPAASSAGDLGRQWKSTGATGFSGIADLVNESLGSGHASNWELVSRSGSTNGHPLAVMGPQVGYYLPQILMEQDIHAPGIDARGVSFAGSNLYVQMGHGRDYAWSATSAGSDNVDTFAEVLCGGDRVHYVYRGKCRAMQRLTRSNSWTPNVIDPTPAGSATLTSYRTVHGIVNAYGRVGKKRVAFAIARTTYFHEADSVIGFARLNNPNLVKGPSSFQRAVAKIMFTFNWSYADSRHNAYYLSGAYPQRAKGTSPDFPILGTGKYDWRGFHPKTWTEDVLGFDTHPRTVDPRILVSWNNKPARNWSAADDQWGYGPIYRSQLISDKIRASLRRGDITAAQVVQAMESSATQDIRGVKILPIILRALGRQHDPQVRQALRRLSAWQQAGSHRRDLNKDGVYERNRAVEIMDAWWPLLVTMEFRPALGRDAFEAIQSMIGIGGVQGDSPRPSQYSDGWWSYTNKDLRSLFTPKRVKGPYARTFCGGTVTTPATRTRCRRVLLTTLRQALTVTPRSMYGHGACTNDPQPSCWDKNRPRVTAAINQPGPFPFQNRPTFQQVVSVQHNVSR